MATTYYSLGLMTAPESWRAIRSIRAEPPRSLNDVLQSDKIRKREFHMALEQAQQQFAAAERIGYESRPLNLFYGLSQAGRAIAAGSSRLGRGTDQQWQASGHGLKYNVNISDGVLETPIRQDGRGSKDLFSRVSLATESPIDFAAIKFGAAMNQLVDYTMNFQETSEYLRPILGVHIYAPEGAAFPVEVEVPVPGASAGQDLTVEQVRSFLDKFPALREFEVATATSGGIRWSHNEGKCFLLVNSADQLIRRGGPSADLKGTHYYRKTAALLPAAGESSSALRPLMSWWTVLYALSMLARYAPSKWMKILSIQDSSIASRIEFLLDTAIHAVPNLLLDELAELNVDHS